MLSFFPVAIPLTDCLLFTVPAELAWLLKLGEEACVSITLDLLCKLSPFFTLEEVVSEFLLELSAVVRRETEGEPPMTGDCVVRDGDPDAADCWFVTNGDLNPLFVD